jgi:hypothetical protein
MVFFTFYISIGKIKNIFFYIINKNSSLKIKLNFKVNIIKLFCLLIINLIILPISYIFKETEIQQDRYKEINNKYY